MIFAQIPQEAILHLKGLRFHLFAIVQLEMFESGVGVCKLTPRELSEKYPVLGNYDSLCRYRKAMINDGWLIEVVGGLITKSFDTDKKSVPEKQTDEISVPPSNVLIFNQQTPTEFNNTDEISVNKEKGLTKYQCGTDEISGTPIANKDLDLKDNLQEDSLSPRERETPDFDEASEIVGGVTPTEQSPELEYHEIISEGLRQRMNLSSILPNEQKWLMAIEWARRNDIPPAQCLEVYDLLVKIKDFNNGRWKITPSYWEGNIPQVESLRREVEEFENGGKSQNGTGVNQNGGKQYGNGRNGDFRGHGKPDSPSNSGDYNPFAGKRVV